MCRAVGVQMMHRKPTWKKKNAAVSLKNLYHEHKCKYCNVSGLGSELQNHYDQRNLGVKMGLAIKIHLIPRRIWLIANVLTQNTRGFLTDFESFFSPSYLGNDKKYAMIHNWRKSCSVWGPEISRTLHMKY